MTKRQAETYSDTKMGLIKEETCECTDATHYLVLSSNNKVEVWSERRLPFEPKGWLQSLRTDVRSNLSVINCSKSQVLHAVYISPVKEPCDVDNLLFYNVGTAYFQQKGAGVRLERSFSQVPPQPQGSKVESVQHYQCYISESKEKCFEYWLPTRTLIQWDSIMTADKVEAFNKSKNPVFFWFAVKSGSIQAVSELQRVPSAFGIRLKICVPRHIQFSFIDLLKPMLDGAIGAFHQHDGTNEEFIAKHLASVLDIKTHDVIFYLEEDTCAVLGNRTLFWLRQNGLQWNPADDLCVVVELLVESSDKDVVTFTGELFEVAEKTRTTQVSINESNSCNASTK
jgi:hypothetical protein